LASLGHPCKFQRLSRLGSVTARHSSSGLVGVSQTAALNRGRHLYLVGRPSRWALLAHILVSSFFPRLISVAADWMFIILPHDHTWCGSTANLECRSEMCSLEIQDTKNRHFGTIAQLCPAISSELRHVSTIGKTC